MNDAMTIHVDGMTCEGCARSVRAALLSVAGVTDAQADPETGETHVRTSGTVDREAMASALDEAGFSLR